MRAAAALILCFTAGGARAAVSAASVPAAPVAPAPAPPPGYDGPDVPIEIVRNVLLEGAVGAITRDDLARRSGIVMGEPVRPERIRAAIRILYAIGAFRTVEVYRIAVGPGLVDLVFQVYDRLTLSEIVIAGARAVDREDIVRAARLPLGSEVDVKDFPEAGERIRKYYLARGFLEARVAAEPGRDVDPSRVKLVVQVVEGPATRVSDIVFKGHLGAESPALRAAMTLKVGRPLDLREYRASRDAVRDLLRLRGYYDAAVREPSAEIDAASRRARLTVEIESGPRYAFVFDGNVVLGDAVLEDLAFKTLRDAEKDPGPFAGRLERVIIDKIRARYEEIGFLLAEVEVEKTVAPGGASTPVGPRERYAIDVMRLDDLHAAFDPPGRGDLTLVRFVIDEGRPMRLIAKTAIAFEGNESVTDKELRGRLSRFTRDKIGKRVSADLRVVKVDDLDGSGRSVAYAPAPGTVHPLGPEEVYVPDVFDQGVLYLVDLYRSKGYWDVVIDPPAIALDLDAGFVALTYTVHEGVAQFVREVLFDGATVFRAEDLLRESGLKLDTPLDPLALEEARVRLIELYAANGFLYAEVDYQVARIEADTALVVFLAREGPQVLVREIEIRGAEKTSRRVVLNRLAFREGSVLSSSAIRDSVRALRGLLGVFADAAVDLDEREVAERDKRVIVTVRETEFSTVEWELGGSTDDGPYARFGFSHSNLLGSALSFATRIRVNYPLWSAAALPEPPIGWPDHIGTSCCRLSDFDALERSVSAGFRLPQLFIVRWGGILPFDLGLDAIHSRRTELAYGLSELGVRATLASAPFVERANIPAPFNFRLEADFFDDTYVTYSSSGLANLPPSLVPRLFPDARIALVSIRPVITLDLRDDRFNPKRGVFVKLTLDYVVSVVDGRDPPSPDWLLRHSIIDPTDPIKVHALRSEVQASGYVPIGGKWVLALQGGIGSVINVGRGDAIPPDRAFFLGGRNTIRGYYEQRMVPEDVIYNFTGEAEELAALRVPARFYMLARAEFRVPIGNSGLEFAGFADIGNSWANLGAILENPFFLRVAVGPAIRYLTPIGPLSIEVGWNVFGTGGPTESGRPRPSEGVGAIHVSLGVF